VLTVFDSAAHRALVQETCATQAPQAQVVDVSTPTDAVLALLAEEIDLVLVDIDLSGDLLAALVLHVRRSAPHATLLGFGDPQQVDAKLLTSRKVLPLQQLGPALSRWLGTWRASAAD
jgi:DNA-binding NarL/FixJ family response regulator